MNIGSLLTRTHINAIDQPDHREKQKISEEPRVITGLNPARCLPDFLQVRNASCLANKHAGAPALRPCVLNCKVVYHDYPRITLSPPLPQKDCYLEKKSSFPLGSKVLSSEFGSKEPKANRLKLARIILSLTNARKQKAWAN